MISSKALLPSSNLHLPPISKVNQHHFRSSPTPPITSMTSDNVSALKAKYTDYAMWLKASSRQNREPIFTHELLKHSLCQMGIDSTQAEQLVSTCSWYVYQFQKELGVDTEQTDQIITTETKKDPKSSNRRHKKTRTTKSKKRIPPREYSAESSTTITSINKEYSVSPGASSPIRNKFPVLPAIQPSGPSLSPRSRRVDFDNEKRSIEKRSIEKRSIEKQKPAHWRSAILKARILPKLRSSLTESSVYDPNNITPESTLVDFDLSTSQKISHRTTRSILRKQTSSSSSVASTDISNRKNRPSTIIDEIPLGTKSQRLFGGSECFAEIMNELEEQNS